MEPARAGLALHACGGWIAAATAAAARYAIADHLAEEPLPVETLALRTGTMAKPLDLTLRALAAVDLFTLDEHGRYANTAESEFLRSDHPFSLRYFSMLAGELYQQAFAGLADSLVSSRSSFRGLYGTSIYQHLDSDPRLADIYDRAMEDLARPVGAQLAGLPLLRGAHTIVDIGGGRGGLIKALLRELPSVEGIVIDRADVCARAGVDNAFPQLRFVPGDFFADLPAGGDCLILKNVLHNWNEDNCRKILGTIVGVLARRQGASLLVLERLAGTEPFRLYGALNDLMQFVICEDGAWMRTPEAMHALLASAGLRVISESRLPSGHAVFETAIAA